MIDDGVEGEHGGVDPGRCPLCGGPNECVMASGDAKGDAPCWCEGESFPRELLDEIPETSRRRACVCRRCVTERPCVAGSSSSRLRFSKKRGGD